MPIKERIGLLLDSIGFVRKKVSSVHFLEKKYQVIEGTFRTISDKDDGWLFEMAKHHKIIVDVGCNIGQAAMLMLYHNSVDKILMVDPNPNALSVAAENLIMNHLVEKALFSCRFLSDKPSEEVRFYTVGSGAAGSKYSGFARTAKKLQSSYIVPTSTLDSLCQFYALKPTLVKIDVEGAEMDVLNGAKELAASQTTVFFVEVHSGPEVSITENTGNILQWCNDHRYKAWYLKDKQPLTIDSISKRGRYHTLLLPESFAFPDYLCNIEQGSSPSLKYFSVDK